MGRKEDSAFRTVMLDLEEEGSSPWRFRIRLEDCMAEKRG